jgi:hypothetical protein
MKKKGQLMCPFSEKSNKKLILVEGDGDLCSNGGIRFD